MLYIRDLGMATYNLLNFKMRPGSPTQAATIAALEARVAVLEAF